MEFIAALNEMAAKIGLSALEPDETGSVTLLFDGRHEVSFVPDSAEGTVYFQSELADSGSLRAEDMRALLEASLSGANGAAFSINRPLDKVVIWKRFGEFASSAALEGCINEFLGQAIRWKQKLAEGGLFSGAAAQEASAADGRVSLGFMTGSFIQV